LFTNHKARLIYEAQTQFKRKLHMEPAWQQRIRERAYEIWSATGREDGRADEHWLSAERELLTSAGRQPTAAKLAESPKVMTSNKVKVNRPRMTLSR
jgi:Protein of unknown function (DUF2934)